MKRLLYLFIGGAIGIAIIKGVEPWRPDIVTQERAALLTKHHVWCYQDIVINHCINDSIFIDFDSLYEIYRVSCGIRIDSIINGEIQ